MLSRKCLLYSVVISWLYCKVYVGDSVDIGIDAAACGRILGPTWTVRNHVCRSTCDPYNSGSVYTNNIFHFNNHEYIFIFRKVIIFRNQVQNVIGAGFVAGVGLCKGTRLEAASVLTDLRTMGKKVMFNFHLYWRSARIRGTLWVGVPTRYNL